MQHLHPSCYNPTGLSHVPVVNLEGSAILCCCHDTSYLQPPVIDFLCGAWPADWELSRPSLPSPTLLNGQGLLCKVHVSQSLPHRLHFLQRVGNLEKERWRYAFWWIRMPTSWNDLRGKQNPEQPFRWRHRRRRMQVGRGFRSCNSFQPSSVPQLVP